MVRSNDAALLLVTAALLNPGNAIDIGRFDRRQTGLKPCDALINGGLKDRVLLRTDAGYQTAVDSWWATNARLHPSCIVQPRNTQEVAKAVTTLDKAGSASSEWQIAVRGGGHALGGMSNIDNGVTIDLTNMNGSSYDSQTNIAKVQPGGRWKNVYADLLKDGVTVAGGHDGGVGVGGYMTGGGMSSYMARRAWGCDDIVNHEVVLANGSVVNANKKENADLWKALKGGQNNFGIVTRFDLTAIPAKDHIYHTRTMDPNNTEAVVDFMKAFTDRVTDFRDDEIYLYYTYNAANNPPTQIMVNAINTAGNTTSPAFNDLKKIPAIAMSDERKTIVKAANDAQVPAGNAIAGYTLTFKNDAKIIQKCVDILDEYVTELSKSMESKIFSPIWLMQPLPAYFSKISQAQGGNMLGLERVTENSIVWDAVVALNTNDDNLRKIAQDLLAKKGEELKEFSVQQGGDVDFLYLNYAYQGQDPLRSYGPENVQYMKEVAAKYDPAGFFQTRVPGGFKISKV